MGNEFCSPAGSTTDLLTNVTGLAPVTPEDFMSLLSPVGAVRRLALDFIHESTHQWCLNSPVGTVLAYLHARALAHAGAAAHGAPVPHFIEFYDDVIRLETARELLRPLMEGMAMFAEFDARTGPRSASVSLPLEQVTWFLDETQARTVASDRDPMRVSTTLTNSILADLRLSQDAVKRRVNLLSQPLATTLSGRPTGGYLLGYLTVKSLWRAWMQATDGFAAGESDLFLSYLRAYIFRDWGFAEVLLNEDYDGLDSIRAISSYFAERLERFSQVWGADAVAFLRQWDELANARAAGIRKVDEGESFEDDFRRQVDYTAVLNTDPHRYASGILLWTELTEQLDEQAQALLSSRRYMHMGKFACTIETMPGRKFGAAFGKELFLFDSPGTYEVSGAGQVDVFFPVENPMARIVKLSQSGQTVGLTAYFQPEDPPGDVVLEQVREFGKVDRARSAYVAIEPAVRRLLAENDRLDAAMLLRNEVAPGHAWDAYLPVSMMGCTWELTSELSDRLSSRGLLAFPGMKRPTLEAAALLGLAAGASVPVSELPATFERFLPGTEPESVLGWFRERAAADGYPRFRLHDNVLVAQI